MAHVARDAKRNSHDAFPQGAQHPIRNRRESLNRIAAVTANHLG